MDMHDFILLGGPKEFLLTPKTDDAKTWFSRHIDEDAESLGHGVLVLPRFLDDILKDIDNDGLTVKNNRPTPG